LGSIGGSNLGSARDSIKESSLTTKASNVLEVVAIRCPVNVVVWIKFEIHVAIFTQNLKLSILRLPLIASQTLPGAPSNQIEQTGSIKE
jgi:hypothetical protein